ncbi:MAG: 2Fe-2S iron-sulfur cluster-binding protein, partial [bacterium]
MNDNILLLNTKKLIMDNRNWNYTIIQLCEELGISIPRFCYHRELSIVGNCRMCMVELKTSLKPVIACATSLTKNMQIFTNSELVKIARGNVLEFLLINHPLDCPICDQGGECDLQDQAFLYGSDKSRFSEYKRSVEDKNFGPVIKTVMSRCIHCTRCIRYAEEIIGVFSLGTMGRGKETEISTYNNSILQHEMLGNIADICPVGALLIKPTAFKSRTWDLENLDLLDIFDSLVGTAAMGIKGNELIRVLPRKNDSLNREWLTDKIRFFYEGAKLNRLLYPLVKISNRLVHTSLSFSCKLYVEKLYTSYSNKNNILGLIGEELNYYDSFLISHFTDNLNINIAYVDSIKKHINSDLRVNWLLNNNIQNFINNDNFIFINVNLKYECSILNSLLYKH